MSFFKTTVGDLVRVSGNKPGGGGTPGGGGDPVMVEFEGGDPLVDMQPADGDGSELSQDVLPGSEQQNAKPMSVEDIKKALEEAQKHEAMEIHDKTSSDPGKGMGGRRVAVPADFPVATDWARVLINLLNKSSPGPSSWSKVHKRTFGSKFGGTPIMIPGRKPQKEIGHIIVAIDTSGSITDNIVNGFLSELRRVFEIFKSSQTFGCKIILWSGAPYAESKTFSSREFDEMHKWSIANLASGGTAIDPVVQKINSMTDISQFVGTVWFTDGEINDLKTKFADMDQIFVINGFITGWVKKFLEDVKVAMPQGKHPTLVQTSYGYRD